VPINSQASFASRHPTQEEERDSCMKKRASSSECSERDSKLK
jgi:hypothetical protein